MQENLFFDVGRFPKTPGMLIFLISPGNIAHKSSPIKCFEYIEYFAGQDTKKIALKQVGAHFVYGDSLYLYTDQPAAPLRNKLLNQVFAHKNGVVNTISESPWYIEKYFSFSTWNQLIIDTLDFPSKFGELRLYYEKDENLQKYMALDAKNIDRPLDENQIKFFLEEILAFMYLAKMLVSLKNDYLQGHDKWRLLCYPGKPLLSEIYLFQQNPLKLPTSTNPYELCYYDLEEKKLYDYSRTDIEGLIHEWGIG